MSQSIIHVDDDTFDAEVISAKVPVLVDFFAEWCGPCKMVGPLLEQVVVEYAGRLKVVKVDVDKSPEAAQRYGVRGIPTMILFKDGTPEATKVGAMTKTQLVAFIESGLQPA